MRWHPDVPDLPINKPKEIEKLESMDRRSLDSMPGVEINKKIEQIANAVAREYKEQKPKGTYSECMEVVQTALTVTGSAIGGKVGIAMIAECENAAKTACQTLYSG